MIFRLQFAFLVAFLSGSALAQYAGALAPPRDFHSGFEMITVGRAKELLGILAGPGFRGRSPLNGDYGLAAGWLSGELASHGILPAGDDGTYFHRFIMWDTTPIPTDTFLQSKDNSVSIPFGIDFSCTTMIEGTWVLPPLAFVHVAKDQDLSKLSLDALNGRLVILDRETSEYKEAMSALRAVASKQKITLIQPNSRKEGDKVTPVKSRSIKDFPDPRRSPIGSLSLSDSTIASMAKHTGAVRFLASNETTVDLVDKRFQVTTRVNSTEFPMENVIGMIPGSDPLLKSEAIMLGSHLDHLGPQQSGIHFGADDNGSGCTANLLIAEAINKNPIRPKRTVIFCFWSCEELGLLGSYAYVQRPTWNLKDISAYINMDMLGRNENDKRLKETAEMNTKSVYPSGVAFNSPEFLKILFEMNRYTSLELKPDVEDRIMRSDSGSFAWKEIPTVKVFTGDHEDYHKASDTLEKINYEKLVSISRWIYLTAETLAGKMPRPKWEPKPFSALPWPDPRKKS